MIHLKMVFSPCHGQGFGVPMCGMDQMLIVLSRTDSASPLNPNRVTLGPEVIG